MADDGNEVRDLEQVVLETRYIWDTKAAFWDAGMGEGNLFQRELVGPAAERLLDIKSGEAVLDIACGNGVFSRRLAALGAHVVATDFSQQFLNLARTRTTENADRIEYLLVDATSEEQVVALGAGRFDAVVCNMALMDMPVIEPLLNGLRQVMKPAGRFVFTIQHPAFNSNATRLGVEEDFPEGRVENRHFVKVYDYHHVLPGKGPGMPGEPEPHWYFHRSLQDLLGACFTAGFLMDGLEEPALPQEHAGEATPSWRNMHGIPPVLAARFRLSEG